jgi:hypothetical protein
MSQTKVGEQAWNGEDRGSQATKDLVFFFFGGAFFVVLTSMLLIAA